MSIPDCYRKGEDYVYYTNGSDVPCSGSSPSGCCVKGSFCLESGICHDGGAGNGQSGYYMQSCTEQSYKNAACPRPCTDLQVPDVVYNYTSGLWSCCGYNATSELYGCADPDDETFQAPPPSSLLTITSLALVGWTLGSSSTTLSSNTATTTNSVSTTAAPTSGSAASATNTSTNSDDSSGLSTGAEAGIGVGVAVVAIATIGALIWALLARRKRKRGANNQAYIPTPTSPSMVKEDPYTVLARASASELNAQHNFAQEVPSNEVHEMQSKNVRPVYELDDSMSNMPTRL